MLTLGGSLRSSSKESLLTLDLNRNSLYIRQFNEGPIFGQLKLMSASDEILYNYLVETKQSLVQNPKSSKVTFLSHQFWEKILQLYKEHVVASIKYNIIGSGGRFGVLIDMTQDVSKKEQLSVILKYPYETDKTLVAEERTIAIRHIKTTTGKEIYELMKSCINDIGLDISNITG